MRKKLLVGIISMLSVVGMVSACTPPSSSGGLPKEQWSFQGTQVTVDKSQDCTLGFINCADEPFLLNIAFRVKIGKKNSAETWVVNNRTSAPQDVSPGTTVTVSDAAGGRVNFTGVKPVDLLDLTNPSNKLEIVGTYTWATEEDQIGLGWVAGDVAGLLKDGLNATLATASLDDLDAQMILNLVFSNLGAAFSIGLQNFMDIDLGLGDLSDDVLGGGLYIGIAARGTLGSTMNSLLKNVQIPGIDIPLVNIPPSIDHVGLYTFSGSKTWTHQFSGQGGKHTWTMTASKN